MCITAVLLLGVAWASASDTNMHAQVTSKAVPTATGCVDLTASLVNDKGQLVTCAEVARRYGGCSHPTRGEYARLMCAKSCQACNTCSEGSANTVTSTVNTSSNPKFTTAESAFKNTSNDGVGIGPAGPQDGMDGMYMVSNSRPISTCPSEGGFFLYPHPASKMLYIFCASELKKRGIFVTWIDARVVLLADRC